MRKKLFLFCLIILPGILMAQRIEVPLFFNTEPVTKHLKNVKIYYSDSLQQVKDFLCYEADYDSAGRFKKQQFWQYHPKLKSLEQKLEYVYLSANYRYFKRKLGGKEEQVYQYLNKENMVDSSRIMDDTLLKAYIFNTYAGDRVLSHVYISAKGDTLMHITKTYDSGNMLKNETDFIHYHADMGNQSPSIFKKTVERMGDSLVIKSEHYRDGKLSTTSYSYKIYKKGKIVKEYFTNGNGPYVPVDNPIRRVITYTYTKKGFPSTMKEEMIEYSKVTSWKLFRAEYTE